MKKGFTLIEVMAVVLIFTFLFAAILNVLTGSNRSWLTAQNKLIEQQEARKAMGNIVRLLRQSNPVYGVTISTSGCTNCDKIIFYIPIFNEAGDITDTHWVIFKPNADNCLQLLRKEEGDTDWTPVAGEIESIKFYGGDCLSCGCNFSKPECSDCTNITDNCPVVKIEIKTKKENKFSLSSYATLRNYSIISSEVPEPPAEGEF